MAGEGLGRIEGRMTGIEKELQTLNRVLIGNGQPGVMERMARAEENIDSITMDTKELVGAVGDLAKVQASQAYVVDNLGNQIEAQSEQIRELSGSVSTIAEAVGGHCKDSNLHSPKGLLLRKEVIVIFVLAVIVIVGIVSTTQMSVWDMILKYIGL